jgi:VanZ family protein
MPNAGESANRQPFWSRVSRYGPLLVWMAFISFASSDEFSFDNTSRIVGPVLTWLFPGISDHSLAFAQFFTRKAAHFSEFGLLAILAGRAFRTATRPSLRRRWFAWSLLLIVVYAFLDEFHQRYVPSRTSSVFDSIIDIAGGLTLLFIYRVYHRCKGSQRG